MAATWKQHIVSHKTYLQDIDDLILTPATENENTDEAKENREEKSGNKKSWFGLWSK